MWNLGGEPWRVLGPVPQTWQWERVPAWGDKPRRDTCGIHGVLYCAKCKYYAILKVGKLAKGCELKAPGYQTRCLNRILEGKHPLHDEALEQGMAPPNIIVPYLAEG